jgi:hypothetical protein
LVTAKEDYSKDVFNGYSTNRGNNCKNSTQIRKDSNKQHNEDAEVDHLIGYVDFHRPAENIKERSWCLCKICARNGFRLETITFREVVLSKIEYPNDIFRAKRIVVGRVWSPPFDYYDPEKPHEHKLKEQQPKQSKLHQTNEKGAAA